jgi:hypothetical protein
MSPKSAYKGRGRVLRYRTMTFNHKYAHVAVVSKKGKRGGRTIMGVLHTRKHPKKKKYLSYRI